jgi:hypothetical protein
VLPARRTASARSWHRVGIGRLNRRGAIELLLIRGHELPISGVRKTRRPKRAAIDELGLLPEPLIVFEDGRPLNILTLISIFLHLVGDGHKIV